MDKFNASIGFDKRMWKEDIMVMKEILSDIYKSVYDVLLPFMSHKIYLNPFTEVLSYMIQ